MKINGIEISLGADPEVFLRSRKTGKLESAYGLLPGTKRNPFPVRKGAVEVDGMAAEFLIEPAKTTAEFYNNIQTVLKELQRMVPSHDLVMEPVAEFGAKYIDSQPREAKELGCDPDYNAYTGKPQPRPNADAPFRTGSGHVHIGWTTEAVDPLEETHMEACCWLAQTLDAYLGIPAIGWDRDTKRRQLYGQAGSFRPKPYGMEYRVLSNVWLTHPRFIVCVAENTFKAVKALLENPEARNKRYFDKTAREIVDTSDRDAFGNVMHFEEIPSSKSYAPMSEEIVGVA